MQELLRNSCMQLALQQVQVSLFNSCEVSLDARGVTKRVPVTFMRLRVEVPIEHMLKCAIGGFDGIFGLTVWHVFPLYV